MQSCGPDREKFIVTKGEINIKVWLVGILDATGKLLGELKKLVLKMVSLRHSWYDQESSVTVWYLKTTTP